MKTIIVLSNTGEYIEKIFILFNEKCNSLGKKMERSKFNLKFKGTLCITCEKVNAAREFSFTKSPNWLWHKNARTNPQNNDNRYFRHALVLTQIKNHCERVLNIVQSINQYNWDGINYPMGETMYVGVTINYFKVIMTYVLIYLNELNKYSYQNITLNKKKQFP